MTFTSLRGVAIAIAAAIGLAAASVSHAAPANHQPPPKFKIKTLHSDVLVCNPHAVLNYLVVKNHHAAKTFPKGAKIFYLARAANGAIVAKGWYTLTHALKPGHRVGIKYGSMPLPRSRKATYCRTYIKYYA